MGFTTTDIVTEHGQLYKDQGKRNELIDLIIEPSETAEIFPILPTVKTVEDRVTVGMSPVLQAFQKKVTKLGGMTFKPVSVPLYHLKIDDSVFPHDLENTYVGFLAQNNLKPAASPIVPYWLKKTIQQSKEDLETSAICDGIYEAPADGVAGEPAKAMNGIRTIINLAIDDTKITPISLGAVPTDPVDCVDYIEDFWANIDEVVREQIDFVNMSRVIRDRFRTGMRMKYNMNYQQADLDTIINSNVKVRGLLSHKNTTKIWATPVWNRVRPVKNPTNQMVFDVQVEGREVICLTDYWMAVNFWVPQYVFTNDVDLTHGVPE